MRLTLEPKRQGQCREIWPPVFSRSLKLTPELISIKHLFWLCWTGSRSKEWTPETSRWLNHPPGNDWVRYGSFLARFSSILMHKIFDSKWTVAQQCCTFEVPLAMARIAQYFELTVQPLPQENNAGNGDEQILPHPAQPRHAKGRLQALRRAGARASQRYSDQAFRYTKACFAMIFQGNKFSKNCLIILSMGHLRIGWVGIESEGAAADGGSRD
ncbi:cysteine proteinase [Diaporthe amygdali]|uniref:cysteine proteinase n=1 Tax=Phomopsis amygdali TaxID=1214568 RepID=UPI0022FE608F|nr:cysteine proteinase [Diaporthe amygdali]KAJ0103932.1 cysteine proteinase [Diaporthe amygdali]